MVSLQLSLMGEAPEPVEIRGAVIAGWTARDAVERDNHIAELEALGVRRPASTPIFYHVAAARLTTAAQIEALGTTSSGEVEAVLMRVGGRLWVGVGSDHTDREVEAYGVTVSKQMCDKPIASKFWPFDAVSSRWDSLVLRSYRVEGDERLLYQEGPLSHFLPPGELMARLPGANGLPDGVLMFCGTLPAQGGVQHSSAFAFEIEDPVAGRTITHRYDVCSLPVTG